MNSRLYIFNIAILEVHCALSCKKMLVVSQRQNFVSVRIYFVKLFADSFTSDLFSQTTLTEYRIHLSVLE